MREDEKQSHEKTIEAKRANNGNKAKKEVKAKVDLRGEDKKRSRGIKTNL
jgi:hypothetical protein